MFSWVDRGRGRGFGLGVLELELECLDVLELELELELKLGLELLGMLELTAGVEVAGVSFEDVLVMSVLAFDGEEGRLNGVNS